MIRKLACSVIVLVTFLALSSRLTTAFVLNPRSGQRLFSFQLLAKGGKGGENGGGGKGRGGKSSPMTQADAARIQSAAARQSGGQVEKGSFAARAQSAADKAAAQKK